MDGLGKFGRFGLTAATVTLLAAHATGQVAKPTDELLCTIGGTVTDGISGERLVGVVVSLAGPTSSKQLTDRGRFLFSHLACGSYRLTGFKPGYMIGRYGPPAKVQSAPIVVTRLGASFDAPLRMYRYSGISGNVRDEFGDPVVGAYVRALPVLRVGTQEVVSAGPITMTDDLGDYRIGGLAAGKDHVQLPFVQTTVLAGTSSGRDSIATNDGPLQVVRGSSGEAFLRLGRYPMPPPTLEGYLRAYAPSFYPGTRTLADAAAIRVSGGEERGGINLILDAVRTFSVSGTLIGSPEEVRNLRLRLLASGTEMLAEGAGAGETVTDAFGRFTFLNVPQGAYVVAMADTSSGYTYDPAPLPQSHLPASDESVYSTAVRTGPIGLSLEVRGTRSGNFWLAAPLVVDDRDIENLQLPLRSGASIMIDVQGDRTNTTGFLATRVDADASAAYRSREPLHDNPHRFIMTGLPPGQYSLNAMFASVETLTCEGHNVMDQPLTVSEAASMRCTATLLRALASIEGVVESRGSGADFSQLGVIVFPADMTRTYLGPNPQRFSAVAIDNRGTFRVGDLPPGEYLVAAVGSDSLDRLFELDFLKTLGSRTVRVRVGLGQTVKQNLVFR